MHLPIFLGALCGADAPVLRGGLLLGLAATGAAGSLVHCLPMCGPFVLGQVADRMASVPASRLHESCRYTNGLLLPYHLGRLSTYAALGMAAGALGGMLADIPWLRFLRAALLLAAALLFLTLAVGRLAPLPGGGAWIGGVLRRATRDLNRRSTAGTYLLGVALGFLPCGFLYGALAAAAASGGPFWGAACMLAFGAGTVPALAALGIAGRARPAWGRAGPVFLVFNAAVLGLLAASTL